MMKKLDMKYSWMVNLAIVAIALLGLLTFIGLYGCKPCKETTVEKIIYKDKIVNIPIAYTDSSIIDYVFECDSLYNVIVREKNYYAGQCVTLQDKLTGNKLTVKSYVFIRDTVKIITTDTIKEKQSTIVKNELTKGQQARQTGFWVMLVENIMMFLALLVWVYFKFKSKLIGIF